MSPAARLKQSNQEWIATAFRFCPSCGSANPKPGSVPFRCGHCSFCFFFGPVAAVGGLVINSRGQLLLVRRSRDPGKDKWGLPGGFVDRGETVEEALCREVLEETQLVVRSATLMMTAPNVYTYDGVTADVIDSFYVCRVASTKTLFLAADELCEYRWCIPDSETLDNMAFSSNRLAVEFWLAKRSNR